MASFSTIKSGSAFIQQCRRGWGYSNKGTQKTTELASSKCWPCPATAEIEDDYDQRTEFYPLIECGNFANLLSATKARSSSAGGSSGGVGSEKERVSIRNFSYFSR